MTDKDRCETLGVNESIILTREKNDTALEVKKNDYNTEYEKKPQINKIKHEKSKSDNQQQVEDEQQDCKKESKLTVEESDSKKKTNCNSENDKKQQTTINHIQGKLSCDISKDDDRNYEHLAMETIQTDDSIADGKRSKNYNHMSFVESNRSQSEQVNYTNNTEEKEGEESKIKYNNNKDLLKRFSIDYKVEGGIKLPNNEGEKKFKVGIAKQQKNGKMYRNFAEETNSNYSSSLPPSDLGEKVVNISAIEIDKNDISFYISPRQNEKNNDSVDLLVQQRQQRCRLITNFIIYISVLLICSGVIIYILTKF